MSEGSYPGIALLEAVLKHIGGVLGEFQLKPGPTHFIGKFCPASHINDEVRDILEKGIVANKLFGHKDGQKFTPGALCYRTTLELPSPESLPIAKSEVVKVNLDMRSKDSYGEKVYESADVTKLLLPLKEETAKILENFEKNNFCKDYDEKRLETKKILDACCQEYSQKEIPTEPLSYDLSEKLGSAYYPFATKIIPERLLQYAAVEEEQIKINRDLLEYMKELGEYALVKPACELKEIYRAKLNSVDTFLENIAEQVENKLGTYLQWRLGLEMFFAMAYPKGEAKCHTPKAYLWYSENLSEDLPRILKRIEQCGEMFGTVVIPAVCDKSSSQIIEAWLEQKNHSYIVITDMIRIPSQGYKNPESFLENLAKGNISFKGAERHHARMATVFPPVQVSLQGAGKEKNHKIKTFISPTFGMAAIMSRTALGYNLANRQYPQNIGVLEDIEEIFGEKYINTNLLEKLHSNGVNTISKDSTWPNPREQYIIEPMCTLSSSPDRELLFYERIRANLEYLVQFYVRQQWQGKAIDSARA